MNGDAVNQGDRRPVAGPKCVSGIGSEVRALDEYRGTLFEAAPAQQVGVHAAEQPSSRIGC